MNDDMRQAPLENPEKDTSEWVTGDEPTTDLLAICATQRLLS